MATNKNPLLLFVIITLLTSSQSSHATSPTVVSVADFGAAGDGRRYDTDAIQSAIDACSSSGGGRVLFPAGGSYLTGTLFLKSGVTLEIEKGARILGGTRQEDYPAESRRWYVVLAENATGVGITGGGEVNGQGERFVVREEARKNIMVSWNRTGDCEGDECRPRLVGFVDSDRVKVWNVTLNQPAYWCFHLVRSNNISIHDVSIYGDFNSPNNDGIDIEDSNNTVITRCHIDTGDDAICPKSSTGPVINLTVTDCWIRTKSSAIKLGSASFFDFKKFLFDKITIVDSHRGLGMQIRDGGNVSDVVFSNINISTRYYDPLWWGRAEPIYITSCPRDSTSRAGTISNILFVNITAVSENGVFLSGSRGGLLRNLRFRNVNLTYRRWTPYPGGLYDYRPGCQEMVNHTTAGMMMEHISGLDVENVKMRWSRGNLEGWEVNPLAFRPSTVNKVSFTEWRSDVY
ncbi:exopolygalacturonase [Iris pallida]|uniref:Exopolygalacturonase n=1 Tax=Iris pallida TaxID=29817 RepID=A0AAX6EJN7_IRIPA|nr:exopolygalacturonase [Iris pallida]